MRQTHVTSSFHSFSMVTEKPTKGMSASDEKRPCPRSVAQPVGRFAPRTTVSNPGGSDAEVRMCEGHIRRFGTWDKGVVNVLGVNEVQGDRSGTWGFAEINSQAVQQALDAISYGGAAMDDLSLGEGEEMGWWSAADSDKSALGASLASTWTYVDDTNAQRYTAEARQREKLNTTRRPGNEQRLQCPVKSFREVGSSSWARLSRRPETGLSQVFRPPSTPRTPIPDPAKSMIAVFRGGQETSPPEVFSPPKFTATVPEPVKLQATAVDSPFRPRRIIRHVGHLVDKGEVGVRETAEKEECSLSDKASLGGYQFVLEQAGLDK